MKTLIIGNGEMGILYYNILKDLTRCEALIVNRITEKELTNMSGKIDGIIICTPYEFHYQYAALALKNGISVFVEKPISCSYNDAKVLANLAVQNSLVLFVGQVLRYCEPINIAKKLLSSDGHELTRIDINRMSIKNNTKDWWLTQKRFLLLFEGIHSLDLACYFLNGKLNLVSSSLSYADTRFRGDTGFTALLTNNNINIEIHIEHKIVEENPINQIQLYAKKYGLVISDYAILQKDREIIFANSTQSVLNQAYRNEMNEFIKALCNEPAQICRGTDVLPAMDIIENIYSGNENLP